MSDVKNLHRAIEDNDVTSVKNLVENGADVNDLCDKQTAFTKAVEKGQLMYEIIDIIMASELFNPNASNILDKTPLLIAAKTGNPNYVRNLLAMGAEVDKADFKGVTPLGASALYGNHECASILIEHGANVDSRDKNGATPLLKACSKFNVKVVRLLIKNNCDVNLCAGSVTPLRSAMPPIYNYEICRKKISEMHEICQMLVDAGCDINKPDRSGQTPLHCAVETNDIYNLCFLAENGCDLDIKDNFGYTPYRMAISRASPRYEAARFLLYFGTESKKFAPEGSPYGGSSIFTVLLTPINKLDYDTGWSRLMLLDCLKDTFDPNVSPIKPSALLKGKEGNQYDLQDADIDVIQWLSSFKPYSLQLQILRQIRKRFQGPSIMTKIKSLPIPGGLKKYLNLGVPENSIPLYNVCKLYINIIDGDNQKVLDLIQKDAHNGVYIHQEHSIAVALRIGNTEAAKMLLENTAQSSCKSLNSAGDNILHLVARNGRHELLKPAMDKFKDTNCTNDRGVTALQEAVKAGYLDIAAMIIETDLNVTLGNCDDIPLLHIAASNGHKRCVEILLKRDQDPNMEDPFGNTPLHAAASKGSEYARRSLCLSCFHKSQFDSEPDTIPLALSYRTPKYPTPTYACIEVINLLLKAGADPERKNQASQTALQCAIETMDIHLTEHLQENFTEENCLY